MQLQTHSISKKIHSGPKFLRIFFFLTGIIATIAYRITPFLYPFWVKVAWYVGTIGFILYFWHRSHIEEKRAKLVKEYNLVSVVEKSDIAPEEKSAVSYLVKTSLTSKARFNSLFIVIVSLLALIASILIDFSFIYATR